MSQIKYGARVRLTLVDIDSLLLPRLGLGLGSGVRVRLIQVCTNKVLSITLYHSEPYLHWLRNFLFQICIVLNFVSYSIVSWTPTRYSTWLNAYDPCRNDNFWLVGLSATLFISTQLLDKIWIYRVDNKNSLFPYRNL